MHAGYPNKQRSRKCVLLCQLSNSLPCLKWRTAIHSRKLLAAVHCSFSLISALCFSVSFQEKYGYRIVLLVILSLVCVSLLLPVCTQHL